MVLKYIKMAKKNYYEILGIGKGSTKDEIKKVYKKLALKYHPDRSSEESKEKNEEKFKEISEAYAVLSDEAKRKQYDNFGASAFGQNYNQDDIFRSSNFSSIFEEIFGGFGGGSGGGSRKRRGSDLQYNLIIDFGEAVFGCEKELNLKKDVACEKCSGTGAKNGKLVKCEECGGKGQRVVDVKTPFGILRQQVVCRKCEGSGKVLKNKCEKCNGKGVVMENKKIKLNIPRGIDNNQVLKVRGDGEVVKNGLPGDLLVVIKIKPDKIFEREGDDVYIVFPINFSQAAIGCKLSVPTLYGDSTIKIPEGIESDTVLRLKDKGVENINGYGRGYQFVKIKIRTPEKLTKKQKELFKELSKTEKKNLKAERGFFDVR